MHYYQYNIADYRKDTQHLTPIEHYIYRELMDMYYLDEDPIAKKTDWVLRRLRLGSESVTELEYVLREFFTESDDGWVHGRIEREIYAYRAKVEQAKVNGSKGGRPPKPKKTGLVNSANPEKTGSKANHKPLTNNHKPSDGAAAPARKRFKPPSSEEVGAYLAERGNRTIDPERFIDYYSAQGWQMANGRPMKDWKAAVRTWIQREAEKQPTGQARASSTRSTTIEHDLLNTDWAH